MMPSASSRERLAALGIDVWVRRERRPPETPSTTDSIQPSVGVSTNPGSESFAPRVRMASGDGDWLLVQDAPWDGRHHALLGDIQAAIGSARCRFGQWAHSDSAGVALDELESRGVRHVLVFGSVPPGAPRDGAVLAVGELPELATNAQAKRQLWRVLAEALAH